MEVYYKNDIFGSYQLACECLNDHERTIALKNSITRLVKNNRNVLELGAGTGILSMIAAASGADHVDAVEITKPVADIAQMNIKLNELDHKIKVINKDALTIKSSDLTATPDLVIMEMITTGLIEELQIPAFNNLIKQKIVSDNTICSPSAFETWATLANVDYDFYGFKIKAILHQESWQRNIINSNHTAKEKIHEVDFNNLIKEGKEANPQVEKQVEFNITESGDINSLIITSEAILDGENRIGWTTALNTPVIIPIKERQVRAGDKIRINVSYRMGDGLENLKVKDGYDE